VPRFSHTASSSINVQQEKVSGVREVRKRGEGMEKYKDVAPSLCVCLSFDICESLAFKLPEN
jgi:hypothetical protein